MINSTRATVLNIDFLSSSDQQDTANQRNREIQAKMTESNQVGSKNTQKEHHRFTSNHLVPNIFSSQTNEGYDQYEIQPYIPLKKKNIATKQQKQKTKEKSSKITMIEEKEHDNQQNRMDIFLGRCEEGQEDKEESIEEQMLIRGSMTSRIIKKIEFSSDQESEAKESEKILEQNNTGVQQAKKYIDLQQLSKQSNLQQNQFFRAFCTKEIKGDNRLSLYMHRDKTGFNMLWPNYYVYSSEISESIMTAKKVIGCSTSNFYITSQPDTQSVEHWSFLAKLRANEYQSLYNVFSGGVKPFKHKENKKIRQIMATIKFIPIFQEQVKPRQFQVYILKQNFRYLDLAGAAMGSQVSLDILYRNQSNKQKIHFLKNRQPVYHQQLQGFVLNFHGRVQMPSVKNFILEDSQTKQETLVVGKIKQNQFRMDLSYPMRPDISLCIALANFDSKFC